MSTGELLDRTFALYKRHFWLFAAIAAPAPALYMLFQLMLTAFGSITPVVGPGIPGFTPKAMIGSLSTLFLGGLAYMLGLAITHAVTVRAVSAVHLARPITAGAAYGALKGRYLRIIGVFVVVLFIVFGGSFLLYMAAAMIAALAVAAAVSLGKVATVIGVIVGIVVVIASILLAITLFVRYSLAVQACVVEDIPIMQSLKRSVFLAKGSRNRILTVYVLFVVLQFVIGLTLGLGMNAATSSLHSIRLAQAASALGSFVAGVITSPLATVAMSLVYYDERVRKEAFDLQLMMTALEGPQTNAAASAT
jgi:hypothetical protein